MALPDSCLVVCDSCHADTDTSVELVVVWNIAIAHLEEGGEVCVCVCAHVCVCVCVCLCVCVCVCVCVYTCEC